LLFGDRGLLPSTPRGGVSRGGVASGYGGGGVSATGRVEGRKASINAEEDTVFENCDEFMSQQGLIIM
jgi:hypothetical protein